MNINVGQVHAQPIAPQWPTQQLVDAGAPGTPAVFIRTLAAYPNVFVAPQQGSVTLSRALAQLFGELGHALAQQLFPDQQAVVSALCLVFDRDGQGRALAEGGAFDLDDAIALEKVALGEVRLGQLLQIDHPIRAILMPPQASTGFIAKVRNAYFAGPIVEPRRLPITELPDAKIAACLTVLWSFFSSDRFDTALANSRKA